MIKFKEEHTIPNPAISRLSSVAFSSGTYHSPRMTFKSIKVLHV
jgi:hypothetical protein